MKDEEKIISVLNGLIETCKNGEKGYRDASEAMKYGFYRVLLQDYSRQRHAFAMELQEIVRHLGGTPQKRGSMAGNLHREWMNILSEIADQNDQTVALECERGETAALKNYKNALKLNLPETIKGILEKQRSVIRSNWQRLHLIAHDQEVGNVGVI